MAHTSSADTLGEPSATKRLFAAYEVSGGDITAAIEYLRTFAVGLHPSPSAKSAIYVLQTKLAKKPGATRFTIYKDGFVQVHPA